jgi:hypothetical protein
MEDWSARRLIKAASGEEKESLVLCGQGDGRLFVRARLINEEGDLQWAQGVSEGKETVSAGGPGCQMSWSNRV